jgi:ABC-type molybdate transport system substrate-binding protein
LVQALPRSDYNIGGVVVKLLTGIRTPAGQAEIGIYPASEVAGVKGLTIIGPLPAEINLEIVYGAAATTDSAAPNAAAAFVKFMAAPENRAVWKEGGFEPPTNLKSN